MDIQDMRIFMRVAALCNLSAVGAELGLTPGTISKRIQALEDHLGARLFDRTTRRIRITEEGEIFLAHVERIMTEIADARAAVGGNVSSPKGRLNISAPASLQRWIPGRAEGVPNQRRCAPSPCSRDPRPGPRPMPGRPSTAASSNRRYP